MKRISWDEYFMKLAEDVSSRSPDSNTKHGCVIVDASHKIVSTGYNGFPAGGNDDDLPNTRPEKYDFIIHAEMNAILNARCDLRGCLMYITGLPCKNCLKHIVGVGIKKLIVGNRSFSSMEEEKIVRDKFFSMWNVHITMFDKGL
jgi:dCMP deaminase